MNVQELINELNKVDDKLQEVYFYEHNWNDEHPALRYIDVVEPNDQKYIDGELSGIIIYDNQY